MKWLIDAQLPRRLAVRLTDLGHDAIHTLDLPRRNRSTDSDICRIADASGRILVSKDRDYHLPNYDQLRHSAATNAAVIWLAGHESQSNLIQPF